MRLRPARSYAAASLPSQSSSEDQRAKCYQDSEGQQGALSFARGLSLTPGGSLPPDKLRCAAEAVRDVLGRKEEGTDGMYSASAFKPSRR